MSHNRNTWPVGGRLLSVTESRYLWASKMFRYNEEHQIEFSKGKTLNTGQKQRKELTYLRKRYLRDMKRALKKSSQGLDK